jgi:hypothetical protein
MSYAIRFDYPEADKPVFAGMHKGALGWAPTLATANIYDDAEVAARVLENGYGDGTRPWGRVVQVKAGYPVNGS